MNDKEKLLKAYKHKILAVRNYKSPQGEFFTKDFVEFNTLVEILVEVDTGESDITPAGKKFLEKYYGFEDLALKISQDQKYMANFRNPPTAAEIKEQFEKTVPMQTITFIEESRGNIVPGQSLKEDLLPPEEETNL